MGSGREFVDRYRGGRGFTTDGLSAVGRARRECSESNLDGGDSCAASAKPRERRRRTGKYQRARASEQQGAGQHQTAIIGFTQRRKDRKDAKARPKH